MRREILTDRERVLLTEYLAHPDGKNPTLSVLLHRVKRYWGSLWNDIQLLQRAYDRMEKKKAS